MGAAYDMLLDAEPCLEGGVAIGKAYTSSYHQFGEVSVLQYFGGMASSMDH